MIKKSVIIDIQTGDAQKNLESLKSQIDDVNKSGKELTDDASKGVEDVGKSAKGAKGGVDTVSKGFKGLGTAMKAAGIGLIISAFLVLKEVATNNQKVLDTITTVVTTLQLAFSAVTGAISDAFGSMSELNGGFDATKQIVSDLLTIAFTPLKLTFYTLKAGILGLQLAWEQSFLGKGRPEKIVELQTALVEVKDDMNEIASAAVTATVSIVKNVGEAYDEVTGFVKEASKNIGDINLDAIKAQAKAITELKNQAKIARAVNAGLIEDYDRQAEQQRQIRDDVNKSLSERQEANNKLNAILDEQEKAMIRNANLTIQAAQNEKLLNNNIENQVALQEALNEKKAILAQIEGKRSEQLVNKIALENEALELTNSAAESESIRAQAQREADAQLIKNDELRLEQLRTNLEIDKEVELQRLQNVIDGTNAGTQARVDAEQARLDSIQEFAIKEDELNAEIEQTRYDNKLAKAEFEAENEFLTFEARREAILERERILLEDEALTDQERYELKLDSYTKLNELEDQRVAKQQETLDNIISIVGAETGVGKAFLIAKQLLAAKELAIEISKTIAFSTQAAARSVVAVAEGTAQTAKIGFPQNIPMLIGYAAQAIGIISAITSAVSSAKAPTSALSSAGGGSVSTSVPAAAPQFNVVGTSDTNQLAQGLGGQQPSKAYVVSTDMTSNQQLDRTIEEDATFG